MSWRSLVSNNNKEYLQLNVNNINVDDELFIRNERYEFEYDSGTISYPTTTNIGRIKWTSVEPIPSLNTLDLTIRNPNLSEDSIVFVTNVAPNAANRVLLFGVEATSEGVCELFCYNISLNAFTVGEITIHYQIINGPIE